MPVDEALLVLTQMCPALEKGEIGRKTLLAVWRHGYDCGAEEAMELADD